MKVQRVAESLSNRWICNEGEQQPTLESLAADYLRHLKHHLAQIESAVLT